MQSSFHNIKNRQKVSQNLGKYSLTEKQLHILTYIKSHIEQVGYPPSIREMGEHFALSPRAIRDHIKYIQKKGYIRVVPKRARGIEIVPEAPTSTSSLITEAKSSTLYLPMIGHSISNNTSLLSENATSYIPLHQKWLQHIKDTKTLFAIEYSQDHKLTIEALEFNICICQLTTETSKIKLAKEHIILLSNNTIYLEKKEVSSKITHTLSSNKENQIILPKTSNNRVYLLGIAIAHIKLI